MLVHRLNQSAVVRKPRLVKVANGLPVFENGEVTYPKSVIWCTGYQPDYSWINIDLKKHKGWSVEKRGVVSEQPGLYFLGTPFQNNAASSLVGGVGADARYIAEHIRRNFKYP
jgi:putative flavoprotein involved in K+ transport